MQNNGLLAASEDMKKVWKFYKEYAPREPKDDAYWHDIAIAADKTGVTTRIGRAMVRTALDVIAKEDYGMEE